MDRKTHESPSFSLILFDRFTSLDPTNLPEGRRPRIKEQEALSNTTVYHTVVTNAKSSQSNTPFPGILDPFLLASLQDKASQVSEAEEPHGVTYAELNTRALSEGPSSQTEQPLETCVYSTLKA